MRCHCFAHAQLLLRRRTPVLFVPQATVRHEPVPFVTERLRQGFDAVAVLWIDPQLPARKLLRLGPLAVGPLYLRSVLLDWLRLAQGRRDLQLSPPAAVAAAVLLPFARLIDAGGMLRALMPRARSSRFAATTVTARPEAG